MPYKPSVRNRAGEIMAQGITGGARAEAAGITASADSIAAGISSAGSSLAGGIQKAGAVWQQQAANKAAEAAKWNTSLGKIGAMTAMGMMTPEQADALAGINNPDKLAGAMAVIESDLQQQAIAKRQEESNARMFDRQYALEAQKHAQKKIDEGQSKVGQTTVIVDPVSGEKTSFVYQNDAQIIPLNKTETKKKAPVTEVKKVPVGPGSFIYTDQEGNIISPSNVESGNTGMTDAMKAANAAKLTRLKSEQATLAGEVAKGNTGKTTPTLSGRKPAPNWWPFTESNEDKLKGITAEINALEGGTPESAQSALAQTGTNQPPPSGDYSNPQAVAAAVRAGVISREAGVKILQDKFGYQ